MLHSFPATRSSSRSSHSTSSSTSVSFCPQGVTLSGGNCPVSSVGFLHFFICLSVNNAPPPFLPTALQHPHPQCRSDRSGGTWSVIIRQLLKTSKTEIFFKKEKNLLKDSEISPLPYCPLLIYMLYLKNRILY